MSLTSAELFATTQQLSRSFFARGTEEVARDLLGTVLVHDSPDGVLAGRIVEVEAYLGQGDAAAHSTAGRTERTKVIFGPPGHAYVYRIYGIHHCLNVVAEPDGTPGCVLVRAVQPLCGVSTMRRNRDSEQRTKLTNGPGKLTLAMGIGMDLYGADLTASRLTVRLPEVPSRLEIGTSPRIGIRKATQLPLRYTIAGNRYLSRSQRAPATRRGRVSPP